MQRLTKDDDEPSLAENIVSVDGLGVTAGYRVRIVARLQSEFLLNSVCPVGQKMWQYSRALVVTWTQSREVVPTVWHRHQRYTYYAHT